MPAPQQRRGLPFGATVYLAAVGALAVIAAIPALQGLTLQTEGWPTFAILTGGAALAQLFTVRSKRNYMYHTTAVFLVPAVLLLPVELLGADAARPLCARLGAPPLVVQRAGVQRGGLHARRARGVAV